MANAVYPLCKQAFLSGNINVTSDTIKAVLVSTAYTYSATHQYLSDLGANTIGTAVTMTSVTDTNGVLNASSPFSFTGLSSTASANLVYYKSTGTSSTSPLIAFFDTGTGLPVALTGVTEVDVTIDAGSNHIFAL
jgi:hypothetical protein